MVKVQSFKFTIIIHFPLIFIYVPYNSVILATPFVFSNDYERVKHRVKYLLVVSVCFNIMPKSCINLVLHQFRDFLFIYSCLAIRKREGGPHKTQNTQHKPNVKHYIVHATCSTNSTIPCAMPHVHFIYLPFSHYFSLFAFISFLSSHSSFF